MFIHVHMSFDQNRYFSYYDSVNALNTGALKTFLFIYLLLQII